MELIALSAFLVAIFGAIKLMDATIGLLESYTSTKSAFIPFAVFIGLFILILLGINALGKLVKKVIHLTPFGIFDSIIGGLIGILKWAFGFSVIIWVINFFDKGLVDQYSANTYLLPFIEPVAPNFIDFMIKSLPFFLKDFFDNIQ